VKILTTNAPVDCVPYLAGSPEWQIDRHTVYTDGPKKGKYSCDRVTQTSRVVQVDVAVVDSRSPMRWVYGTFAYDGRVGGTTFWDRLVPVGIQFGADPWTFPAVPRAESIPAQQSVLNPGLMGTDRKLFEHFGCEGRLAGPVDNALSSCVSCHSSALVAPVGTPLTMGVNAPMSYGFPGMCTQYSAYNAAYFSNIVPPQTFGGGQYPDSISVDTSLQLEVAVGQYGQFKAAGCTRGVPQLVGVQVPTLSRRELLLSALGAAAAARCGRGSDSGETSAAAPSAATAGVTLTCALKDVVLNGTRTRLRAYNDQIPGPVIECVPGQRLQVTVKNALPQYDSSGWSGDHNVPHALHTTNLHLHGMDVVPHLFDPVGTADPLAKMIGIAPGESREYVFDLPPDHPPGLNWYHPHHHGFDGGTGSLRDGRRHHRPRRDRPGA
jgi:hypothetical protein